MTGNQNRKIFMNGVLRILCMFALSVLPQGHNCWDEGDTEGVFLIITNVDKLFFISFYDL